jgi:Ca2+-transporting ATPase
VQLLNEVSLREMERINVFEGILDNNVFATVLGSTVVFQFIIIQFLGNFGSPAFSSASYFHRLLW